MLKKTRLVFSGVVLLVLSLILSACSNQSSVPSKSQDSSGTNATVMKINVGYLPDLHGAAPIVIGDQKGYFKDAGLQVNPLKFLTGPQEFQAMASGNLDIAYIGPGAFPLVVQGQGKVLTVDSTNEGDVVWATKKSGIKTLSDLKGKNIAVTKGSSAEMILDLALKKVSLKPSDVNLVNMDVAGSVAAFVANKVDAVATWVPYTNEIEKQVGTDNIVKLANDATFEPDHVFPQMWVVRPSFLEKNPEAVNRFMKAWSQANDYRISHLDEAVQLTSKFTQVPEDSLKVQVKTTNWIESSKLNSNLTDGTIKKWLGNLENLFIETGKVKTYVDPDQYLAPAPMAQALKK